MKIKWRLEHLGTLGIMGEEGLRFRHFLLCFFVSHWGEKEQDFISGFHCVNIFRKRILQSN